MKTKDIVLWSFIVFLSVLPLVTLYIRGNRPPFVYESEWDKYTPIEDILNAHDGRIKARIDLLKKQTLDESFVELLEDQQYFYPGFQTQRLLVPKDVQRLLSTRTFLKVFQEFDALPREQAIKKLNEFSKKAIEHINDVNADIDGDDRRAVHYLLCTTMLLAAHVGESKLLLNFVDEMQRSFNASIEKIKVARPDIEWSDRNSTRFFGPLEDECFLTILMYALKQVNIEIPIDESTLIQKTIPLCRWDAPLTHYDFAVWHGDGKIDPKDIVAQFIVYEFPDDISRAAAFYVLDEDGTGVLVLNEDRGSRRIKQLINTLKESLPE